MVTDEPPLNPTQQAVLDLLGAPPGARPVFDVALATELRDHLERELASVAAMIPEGDQLYVSKQQLTQVHSCEAHLLAERDQPFSWSVPRARGKVAHKAIELSISWRGSPTPAALVEEAIARLTEGVDGLADWLQTRSEGDLAELRGEATQRVTAFMECFPPIKPQWWPVPEAPVRVELFDGRIVLSGRVDLALGQPRGSVAGKVLIDFKTGGSHRSHTDDLRFYALLDTLRLGTPPRLLASYYLDRGEAHPEHVTADLLRATLRRTTDGVRRIAELLHTDAEPGRRAGPYCRWCPALEDCPEGRSPSEHDLD